MTLEPSGGVTSPHTQRTTSIPGFIRAGALRQMQIPVSSYIRDDQVVGIALPLTEEDISRIAHKLVSILPTVERLPQIACDFDGVQRLLGCRSRSATYRELSRLGVKPYLPGKYRVADIHNAVARLSYRVNDPRKRRQAETKSNLAACEGSR